MTTESINLDLELDLEVDLEIAYDYQPPEPQTRDYPGCDASFDVTAVWWTLGENKIDLLPYLGKAQQEYIQEQLHEELLSREEPDYD